MKLKVIRYTHHGVNVAVQKKLIGKHREHCLCYGCSEYTNPDQGVDDGDVARLRELNCKRAELLYAMSRQLGMVFPVWECPEFMSL